MLGCACAWLRSRYAPLTQNPARLRTASAKATENGGKQGPPLNRRQADRVAASRGRPKPCDHREPSLFWGIFLQRKLARFERSVFFADIPIFSPSRLRVGDNMHRL